MITIFPLIILALASYRLTRFLIIDTLIAGIRNKFHSALVNQAQKGGKLHMVWEKLYDFTSCTFCAGFWVSVILYWTYIWNSPLYWGRMDIINIFAIAAIQSLLHAFEPEDA